MTNCLALANVAPLTSLTNLTELSLEGCARVDNAQLLCVLQKLVYLNLGGCERICDLSWIVSLAQLENLAIHYLYRLTETDALGALTTLKRLTLANASRIKDLKGLDGLVQLKVLDVSFCGGLVDISAISRLTSLSSLNMSDCNAICDVDALRNLPELTYLDLSHCSGIVNIDGLAGLGRLVKLNLTACKRLTKISALRTCCSLARLDLSDAVNIRDLDALSDVSSLRFLTWTETAAPHSVLAAASVLRKDVASVRESASDWLDSVPLSKNVDVFGHRLVDAFALGGVDDWAGDALARLATALRTRAREEGDSLTISTATWAAWANTALGLSDSQLRTALDAAFDGFRPAREIVPVLAPVLTALAAIGPANASSQRSGSDWLVPLVRDVLAPLAANPDYGREVASAAAMFFAGFCLGDEARAWGDRETSSTQGPGVTSPSGR